jgi:hypothetical protein
METKTFWRRRKSTEGIEKESLVKQKEEEVGGRREGTNQHIGSTSLYEMEAME